jgi:hypothetical protein
MPVHYVQQGEYLSRIARRYGLPAERIWAAPENEALRRSRPSPNLLYPGDALFIPELTPRVVTCGVDAKHSFRLRMPGQRLRLVLRDEFGEPLADQAFELVLPGRGASKGRTDGDGLLEQSLPPDCEWATLNVPAAGLSWVLRIGHLDPVARMTGVQQRLRNLGFDPGPIDGSAGPRTRSALGRFQAWAGLGASCEPDAATRRALEKKHDGLARGGDPEDGAPPSPCVTESGEEIGGTPDLEDAAAAYDATGQEDD